MKGNGQGALALSDNIIKEFHSYINTRIQNNPLNFFITADHKNVFIEIRKNTNYRGISGSGPIARNKKKCENKYKQKCFLFANQRIIVWNNGINPIDSKKSKINRKSSYDELIIKLNDLGFIETEEQKAAKEQKLAEEKAIKENKVVEDKSAQEKKLAEEKVAKEKKLAEEKAAKEKLNKKLSLLPVETDLEKAQIFLKNLQEFVKKYPQEFDIIKLSEFFILTKPIVDGNLNVKLEEDLKNLKKFSESSDKFVKYIEEFEINQKNIKLKNIDKTILSIETTISMIKKYMSSSPNSIHLGRWLASVKSAEKVLNDPISYDQLLVEDQKLNKVIEHKKKLYKTQTDAGKTLETLKKYLPDYLGSEISELILNQVKNLDDKIKSEKIDDIVIANNSAKEFIEKEIKEPIRVAEEKKRLEYLKTPEGQAELKEIKEREKAEKERKKRAQKYKDNPIQIICDYGGSGTVTWGYDGEFINMNNGGLLKLGETQLNDFVINVELVKGKKDRFKISYLYFVYEVDFYNKSSTYSALGVNGFGQCY